MRTVALLRGINVGGNNPVRMADLAAMFEELGHGRVETFIQSGNVLFDPVGKKVREGLEKAFEQRFGFATTFVLRTAAEMAAVAAEHPYEARTSDRKTLHVGFLADAPDPAAVAKLDPNRSPPDEFTVKGSEVYLFYPNRSAKTKLTAPWFDKGLKTTTTARNWDTVQELARRLNR